ncbi:MULTISPECIES: peptidoglycan DD-metalloendopeptidase family protein [unclassified Streptomyces]|uniref:M23 family metallopeptidase n=1 Tax=unclassified Streptomyces TaxID=2593676 RepID=UPI00278C8C61|nr:MULTISPECIES: peptidoglycan DD-metalloendopeptidase family protein [unclassified Streptomyces]
MPAKGKQRLSTSQRIARVAAIASAGGAALALPLMGATGAQAATSGGAADAASTANTTYTVKAGDTLSKIAKAQDVDGGWKKLYEGNKDVVGSDADHIKIGMKLDLGGAADSGSATTGTDAAATTQASASTSDADYVKPVDGASGHGYGSSGSMWSSGSHTGADFSVPTGTAVKSIADGTVVSAGDGGAYGNEIVIEHADGHFSEYAHLSSISVSEGAKVTAGQEIAKSGATGNVTGPHLHFEVRTTADYGSDIDPIAYLSQHGVDA